MKRAAVNRKSLSRLIYMLTCVGKGRRNGAHETALQPNASTSPQAPLCVGSNGSDSNALVQGRGAAGVWSCAVQCAT